ncbi:hypothetical protein BKA62DRAFT_264738 [Auriculariales sp. MPI-PUGE-AT-0066]|nr:hypothetical protein BKA62DRAFT_264738 [Auriculariales sp. MPI-PUGE-AT-0066]
MAAVNPSGLKRGPAQHAFATDQHPAFAEKHPRASSTVPALPLPDLRFEQTFLRSLDKFIVNEPEQHDETLQEQAALVQTAHPSKDFEVWRDISWGSTLWLVFRDQASSTFKSYPGFPRCSFYTLLQAVYQLLQGTFLSLVTLTVWPLGRQMLSSIFGGGSKVRAVPKEGDGASRLRGWGRSLLGGRR